MLEADDKLLLYIMGRDPLHHRQLKLIRKKQYTGEDVVEFGEKLKIEFGIV